MMTLKKNLNTFKVAKRESEIEKRQEEAENFEKTVANTIKHGANDREENNQMDITFL